MENKKVFIHAGYTRTATTLIQKKVGPFFQNVSFFDRPKIIDSYTRKREPSVKKEVYSLVEKAQNHKVFISDEALTSLNFFSQIETVYELFPNAHIILTIRNQKDRILSQYYKAIMLGGYSWGIKKFTDIFYQRIINENSFYTHLQYLRMRFKNGFSVYIFEKFVKNWQDLIVSLESLFQEQWKKPENIGLDQSMNKSVVILCNWIRFYNCFFKYPKDPFLLREKICRFEYFLQKKLPLDIKSRLKKEEKIIKNKFYDILLWQNEKLKNEFNIPLTGEYFNWD